MRYLCRALGVIWMLPLFLTLHGCSEDKERAENLTISGSKPKPAASSSGVKLSGTVMKGTISSADCVATTTTGRELYSSMTQAEPCTDDRGRFSFTLSDVPTEPLLLTIKARVGSRMTCDHPAGCGETTFGEATRVTPGLSIRAMLARVESSAGEAELNVTPWSDMAVARAIEMANGDVKQVTAQQLEEAHNSVSDVLNTVLSLHGTADAFDSSYNTVDPVDLIAPEKDIDVDVSDERKGTLLTIASASLLKLMEHSNFNSVEQVVRLVSTDFEDGELNVNGDAGGIDPLEVVSIVSISASIAEVSQGLKTELTDARGESLAAFLNRPSFPAAMDEIAAKSQKLSASLSAVTRQSHFSVKTGRATR